MIYLHRANTVEQVQKAKELGIGIEVDIRTFQGIPVLCHDYLTEYSQCLPFSHFIKYAKGIPCLLDFKEAQIVETVLPYIKYDLDLYLGIDLIVPDMLWCEENGLRTLARSSTYELISGPFYGRWVDYKETIEDIEATSFSSILKFYDKDVLVSPELHGWPLNTEFKERCKRRGLKHVCTDYVDLWKDYIN